LAVAGSVLKMLKFFLQLHYQMGSLNLLETCSLGGLLIHQCFTGTFPSASTETKTCFEKTVLGTSLSQDCILGRFDQYGGAHFRDGV
jgi:hypothetical protein